MNAFLKSQFGYAGAQAVLLLVVLALLSLLSFRMLPTEVEGK
jgi:ABC-type sugar transport system permease subunit